MMWLHVVLLAMIVFSCPALLVVGYLIARRQRALLLLDGIAFLWLAITIAGAYLLHPATSPLLLITLAGGGLGGGLLVGSSSTVLATRRQALLPASSGEVPLLPEHTRTDTTNKMVVHQRYNTLQRVVLSQWLTAGCLGVAVAITPGFALVASFGAGPLHLTWLLLVPCITAVASTQLRYYRLAAALSCIGGSLTALEALLSFRLITYIVTHMHAMIDIWSTTLLLIFLLFSILLGAASVMAY